MFAAAAPDMHVTPGVVLGAILKLKLDAPDGPLRFAPRCECMQCLFARASLREGGWAGGGGGGSTNAGGGSGAGPSAVAQAAQSPPPAPLRPACAHNALPIFNCESPSRLRDAAFLGQLAAAASAKGAGLHLKSSALYVYKLPDFESPGKEQVRACLAGWVGGWVGGQQH